MFDQMKQQLKQFTAKTFGSVENLTQFPSEYLELREQLKHAVTAHTKLKEAIKALIRNGTHEAVPYASSVKSVFSKMERSLNLATSSSSGAERITEHSHLADLFRASADNFAYGSVINEVVTRQANAQLVMSGYRQEQDDCLARSVLLPVGEFLRSTVANAKNACEEATNAQFEVDSVKVRCKKARPEEILSLQEELRLAEEKFNAAVEEATVLMRLAVQNPDTQKWMDALVEAEMAYHKNCLELLRSTST